MRGKLDVLGRFYSKIIIQYIMLFIFVGFVAVIFGENGWYPMNKVNEMNHMVYRYIIPSALSFGFGKKIDEEAGGQLAVLVVAGILAANYNVGIIGAMIMGPISGFISKYVTKHILSKVDGRMKMLAKNLVFGLLALCGSLFSYFCLVPFLQIFTDVIIQGINILAKHQLLILTSILIEPAKVFFLNNGINYGILIPIGMQQSQLVGKSVLFLLESNPGPGIGLLMACCILKKEKRIQYETMLFTHAIGGIHEMYFPVVLSNLKLIIPLIFGGMSGIFCFLRFDVGVSGPVSPGSILTLFMMTDYNEWAGLFVSVGVSAAVTFLGSFMILYMEQCGKMSKETEVQMGKEAEVQLSREPEVQLSRELEVQLSREPEVQLSREPEVQMGRELEVEMSREPEMKKSKQPVIQTNKSIKKSIKKVAFVCDGGMGSSVMGETIFKRKLRGTDLEDIEITHYAIDEIPPDLDLIICQTNFASILHNKGVTIEIYPIDNLVSMDSYGELITYITERNEG